MPPIRGNKAHRAVWEQMRKVIPFYLVSVGLMTAVCIIINVIWQFFDYRLYSGILIGSVLSLLNFYFMAMSCTKAVSVRASRKRAKVDVGVRFFVRHIALFFCLAICLSLDITSPVTLLPPLFFIRLYMVIKANINKGGFSL
ncbi:MAG: ATP synthase subunit I [Oscillospiraceae bacterium]|nr:ATP synthase subunit I [Oscillospiraceae bacterium]